MPAAAASKIRRTASWMRKPGLASGLADGPGGALRKYAVAVLGQSTLGVFNFGLNIVLVRSLSLHDYGSFALCLVLATLATLVITALCSSPLLVFATARSGRPSRLALETMLSTIGAIIVAATFIVCLPLLFAVIEQDAPVCLAAALFVAAFTGRSYTRTFAFARIRPTVALGGDVTLVSTATLAILATVLIENRLVLPLVLIGLFAGNVIAAVVEMRMLGVGARLALRRLSLQRYRAIWRHTRWSLIGATTTLVQSQAHSFLVTIAYGPAAFAPLAAGQVIFGPLRIMTNAWHSIMQPEIVHAIRQKQGATVARAMTWSALALVMVVVAIAAAFALFWHPIFELLYAGKYQEEAMRTVIAIWCAITLCNALWCAPSGVLQSFRQYRELAIGTVWGAALSSIAVAAVLFAWGPVWSLLGILVGEGFMARYTLARAFRSTKALNDEAGRKCEEPAVARQ